MTTGSGAAGASREVLDPPTGEGPSIRVEHSTTSTAGAIRLVIVTHHQPLAVSIEAMSAATDVHVICLTEVARRSLAAREPAPVDVLVLDYACVPDIARAIRVSRAQWPMCGIIVLNVPGVRVCAELLDEGADDACPANSHLVAARVHALMRRARTFNAGLRSAVGDVVIDREHRRVWCAGREVPLSVKEYDVMLCLFDHAAEPVSTSTLAMIAWRGSPPNRNAIEVYVGYVRRKLASSRAVEIRTIRGIGYMLAEAERPTGSRFSSHLDVDGSFGTSR